MFLHWLTTGWRSLVANPLFSLITVISLSIGCTGALLAGANIKQHLSFERWVPDSERIFMMTRLFEPPKLPAGANIRIDGPGGQGRPNTGTPMPMRDAIEGKIANLESQARMYRGASLLPSDPNQPQGPVLPGEPPRTPPPGSVYVDPNFFEMFGLKFVEGSTEGLDQPDAIVITQTAAKRLFGNAPALGQTVTNDQKKTYRIIGVVRDLPPETFLRFEAIASMKTLEAATRVNDEKQKQQQQQAQGGMVFISAASGGWNGSFGGGYFIKMSTETDPELFRKSAQQVLQNAADQGQRAVAQTITGPGGQVMTLPMPTYKYGLVRLTDVHLGGPELTGMTSTGDMTMLITLAAAAIALLGVSAFNYVTLSLARSLRRRQEVAIRKVLGANQGALVRHYLAESGIVTAISLLIGFGLAQLLHPWFARAIGQPETLFNLFDPTFLVSSLVFFALLAVAVGAYPAFYLASVRPRTALGEGGKAAPGRVSQWVTNGLMGLQIAAACGLLIVAASMAAQASYINGRSLGFIRDDRYLVAASCPIGPNMSPQELNGLFRRCQTSTRELIARTKGLGNVSFFNGQLVSENIQMQAFGRSATSEKLGDFARIGGDPTFLQTMGAKLLAGRFFDPVSAYDRGFIDYQLAQQAQQAAFSQGPPAPGTLPLRPPPKIPVIVTKAILPMIGASTPEAAIGQQITQQPNSPYVFDIVGVVDDWNQRPLKYAVNPIIFLPANGGTAVAEIPKDQVADLQTQMTSTWQQLIGAGSGEGQRATVTLNPVSAVLDRAYETDFRLMRAVSSFAIVAIIVAAMGVFGLSAFEMRRRVHEIGIRKALGATPATVAVMVITRAVVFAAVATVIAWPLAFWIANEWLRAFVYRTTLGAVMLPVASLIVVLFVAVAVALNAVRAAAIRPSSALRAT